MSEWVGERARYGEEAWRFGFVWGDKQFEGQDNMGLDMLSRFSVSAVAVFEGGGDP